LEPARVASIISRMEEARSKRGGRPALVAVVVIALVVLPVLYVLSSAQSFALVARGKMEPGTFNKIYAPLIWLSNHSKAVSDALNSYWKWYIDIRLPPQQVELPGSSEP